jgi:hypothetical protein
MWVIWAPILSSTGDRIVGKRQTGASAFIVGDPHRRTRRTMPDGEKSGKQPTSSRSRLVSSFKMNAQ